MSWGVNAAGKPAAVKAALAKQFESARESTKYVPHEYESVSLVEKIVNGQLDFLMDVQKLGVSVAASGSAYKNSTTGYSNVKVEVTPLFSWVE